MCGIAKKARERDDEVMVYLIGDGVLCAKKGQKGFVGENLKSALENGVTIKASENDLSARALSPDHVEPGVEIVGDIESELVVDVMENADRVISW
jgi:sulfur relay protein TusB/DsrH